eukprot:11058385-Ditylum_brightwellii.AAC.1
MAVQWNGACWEAASSSEEGHQPGGRWGALPRRPLHQDRRAGLGCAAGQTPVMRIPGVEKSQCTAFEDYDKVPEVIPLDFTAGSVAFMAKTLQGSARPMGQEA